MKLLTISNRVGIFLEELWRNGMLRNCSVVNFKASVHCHSYSSRKSFVELYLYLIYILR